MTSKLLLPPRTRPRRSRSITPIMAGACLEARFTTMAKPSAPGRTSARFTKRSSHKEIGAASKRRRAFTGISRFELFQQRGCRFFQILRRRRQHLRQTLLDRVDGISRLQSDGFDLFRRGSQRPTKGYHWHRAGPAADALDKFSLSALCVKPAFPGDDKIGRSRRPLEADD